MTTTTDDGGKHETHSELTVEQCKAATDPSEASSLITAASRDHENGVRESLFPWASFLAGKASFLPGGKISLQGDQRPRALKIDAESASALSAGKGDVFRTRQMTHHSKGSEKVFEGWLTKHKRGIMRQDRRRWFVLHENGEVHYFTAPDLQSHKGMISLRGIDAFHIEAFCGGFLQVGQYGLSIQTPGRLWELSCDNGAQATAWKKNLLNVIHNMRAADNLPA